MAATIKFRIGGEDIQYPFEVEDSNGDVSITKVVSALKMMRQSVDKTLNKYVEEEKHRGMKDRGVVESSENMEDSDTGSDDLSDNDDDDDDDGGGDDNVNSENIADNGDVQKSNVSDDRDNGNKNTEHCSPHSKKQKTEL